MMERYQVMEELSNLYKEEEHPVFIRHEYDGLHPDLRVGEGFDDVLVIKVESRSQLDAEAFQSQWLSYDEAYERWHLCVHNDNWNEAEELCALWGIKNVSIFSWEGDVDGDVWFFNAPHLTDEVRHLFVAPAPPRYVTHV